MMIAGMIELDSSATPVSQELAALGIDHRVWKHPGALTSLEQAAAERGQRPEQVVRSIVFRTASGEFVMVLVAGPAQIAWPALRAHLGQSRLTTATEEELLAVTGFTRGAVAPFGLPTPVRVLVDRAVLEQDVISMGSGIQGTTVVLRSVDLMAGLPRPEVGDFVSRSA
jgi:prolyl-tRNA editing enzyme YbaK/EbsC (Cys-tRNA(Pro) deacylase)